MPTSSSSAVEAVIDLTVDSQTQDSPNSIDDSTRAQPSHRPRNMLRSSRQEQIALGEAGPRRAVPPRGAATTRREASPSTSSGRGDGIVRLRFPAPQANDSTGSSSGARYQLHLPGSDPLIVGTAPSGSDDVQITSVRTCERLLLVGRPASVLTLCPSSSWNSDREYLNQRSTTSGATS